LRTASLLATAALLTALLAAGALTFVDTYSGQSCEATADGTLNCTDESRTLVQENGRWVMALFAVPIGLSAGVGAAIAYHLPKSVEWALAFATLAACIVAILSLGAFFLPSALLLVAAVAADNRPEVQV
jgi:hypothetical protein